MAETEVKDEEVALPGEEEAVVVLARSKANGKLTDRKKNMEVRDTSHITCFQCDKLGHYASDCPDRLLKLQETTEKKDEDTQDADELMVNEVVYLNENKVNLSKFETGQENIWYLDNGASNHMSGNRLFFRDLDESITGKVRFGDDSRINIKGRG